jgi:hypothetical protein
MTTEASNSKNDRLQLQQQEVLEDLSENVNRMGLTVRALQEKLELQESDNRIGSLQMMLATLSERNSILEDEVKNCLAIARQALSEAQLTANKATVNQT